MLPFHGIVYPIFHLQENLLVMVVVDWLVVVETTNKNDIFNSTIHNYLERLDNEQQQQHCLLRHCLWLI